MEDRLGGAGDGERAERRYLRSMPLPALRPQPLVRIPEAFNDPA